jgi:hypothetical protein
LNGQWTYPLASYADANHDGLIQVGEIHFADSMVYVGPPLPTYSGGWDNTVTLLNGALSFNTQVTFSGGGAQTNKAELLYLSRAANDPSTPLDQQAKIVAAQWAPVASVVSTVRLNALSVNYRLPTAWASKFRAQMATVSVQGQNLALHTNYSGIDPDVNTNLLEAQGLADSGALPQPRKWQLAINLNF